MPSITIRERDLTSAGNLEVTTNAVYIPGYANMGPINTPTLCETLADFQQIFGTEPYRFVTQQAWEDFDSAAVSTQMGRFYEVGDAEKSYIMAVELLKLGLPVVYERVFNIYNTADESDPVMSDEYWTAVATDSVTSLSIRATTPGYVGTSLWFNVTTPQTITLEDETTSKYFVLTVGRDANVNRGTSKIEPVETKFTFDHKVAKEFSSIKLVVLNTEWVDNSGLVALTYSAIPTTSTTIDATDGVTLARNSLDLVDADDTEDEFRVSDIYEYLDKTGYDDNNELQGYDRFLDKGEYVLKFITSGAYPTFEYNSNSIATKMMEIASDRGDCTALIDHTPNNVRSLSALNTNSVYAKASAFGKVSRKTALGEDRGTFAAMFTPYGIYECSSVNEDVMLPASFGYLAAYAVQIQAFNGWLATAGVTRGLVPNLKALCQNVTNAIADSYQPRDGVAINPITNIKPYGLTLWGARTLKDNAKKGDLTATSFLNIRQLTNDVKRTTWVAAKTLTYEQNNDMLWIKFKMKIMPLLDQMISGSAISSYEFRRESTTKKATVKAAIRLYAIEPVEDWDITIELADSTTDIIG